jgi:lipoyl synthase
LSIRNTNPPWLKKRLVMTGLSFRTPEALAGLKARTVCEEARCPNLNDCFSRGSATFMILGGICTRDCRFCSVEKGIPLDPEPDEPYRVAEATKLLGLNYVVITSVTRDDLDDGGSEHFASVIESVKKLSDTIKIEVLVPDFGGNTGSVKKVLTARPDVFSHNVETVKSLYPQVRPAARYERSLGILRAVKEFRAGQMTKSGIMVGLGERDDEIYDTMRDIRSTGCDIFTIGQYLMPSRMNLPVRRYVTMPEFEHYKEVACGVGFRHVESGPFVRSSYNAEAVYSIVKGGQR